MKRFINIILLTLGIFFVVIILSGVIEFKCIFKTLFNISCAGCGLTRGFKAILNLEFYNAFNYNILSIPLFIFGIIIFIGLIIDIIKNDNKTVMYISISLDKYHPIIIVLVIISTVLNNINGI